MSHYGWSTIWVSWRQNSTVRSQCLKTIMSGYVQAMTSYESAKIKIEIKWFDFIRLKQHSSPWNKQHKKMQIVSKCMQNTISDLLQIIIVWSLRDLRDLKEDLPAHNSVKYFPSITFLHHQKYMLQAKCPNLFQCCIKKVAQTHAVEASHVCTRGDLHFSPKREEFLLWYHQVNAYNGKLNKWH